MTRTGTADPRRRSAVPVSEFGSVEDRGEEDKRPHTAARPMKTERPMVRVLVVLLALAGIVGCAHTRTKESFGGVHE